MCTEQPPDTVAAALAAVRDGLAFLNQLDAAGLPATVQAECLRALAGADAAHTAAQARVLAAFHAGRGYEADGQGSARVWLRWQTRATRGAAAGAMDWMKRLAAHPALARALAGGAVSASWARQIAAWSDLLPEDQRAAADEILLAAAAGGAELADLAALAEEMRRRTAGPDDDSGGGFGDRALWLDVTFGGAGRLAGDLTPACAAALSAVLDTLGKKAGPEDTRTATQRRHDALEEACRRLAGSGCLPDRAGQPAQVQLHLTLDQLRDVPGASDTEAAWAAGRAAADGQPGWLTGQAAEGYACDAAITPIVTGHVDPAALAVMTTAFLNGTGLNGTGLNGTGLNGTGLNGTGLNGTGLNGTGLNGTGLNGTGLNGTGLNGTGLNGTGLNGTGLSGAAAGSACRCGGCTCRGPTAGRPAPGGAAPLRPATRRRLQDTLLRYAADVLSGPAGLAAFLRSRQLGAEFPAVSLPLDVGAATETIPAHLRRAVAARDRHCRFPGCEQPPAACHVHHLRPRAEGGPTSLGNCMLLCSFHHLIAVHEWGWVLSLQGDGTVTAVAPDGTRTLHGHGPPSGPP